ncbi:MAG: CHAT domain-containing protein, partial [Nitrospirae bacterium]|nr:CHAT domain-containing protein [Nitrospirota bacterium]
SESEFTQSIRSFRRLLEKRTTRQYLPHAHSLYNLLIRPMEPLLEEFHIDTLVFVPDGPLRTIPMSSLHDGQRFLIENYAVATTPGLTLTDAEPINRKDIQLLSVGLTKPTHGFSALPNVEDEINALQVLYGGQVLLNEQFVIPQMEKIMKKEQFSIVHIASHGQFESKVENSFLLAFDGKITMNRLDELIGLFQFRDSPLDLLVLSACETAAGDDQAALGLAGVAIKAGARSALATLWFINDKASSDIVIAFYKELTSPNTSKAQALRHAQLELIAHPTYQHPSYWAPFLIINNWL